MPVGEERVGCIGRRSPGRSGGRAPGAPGRGLWKIGWPGTGRPGAGREGAAACGRGGGAWYTGRGPVCGITMRRCGTIGWPGFGAPGRACAVGAAGCVLAAGCCGMDAGITEIGASTGKAGSASAAGGGATTGASGVTSSSADAAWISATSSTGGSGARAASGPLYTGRAGASAGGLIRRGAGTSGAAGAGGAGAAGLTVTGGAGFGIGFADDAGTAIGFGSGFGSGRAGAEACCFFASSSFSTSPGLETWDQSILVSIPSAARPAVLAEAEELPPPVMCARTFSASSTVMELEWVFFSVTPTSGSVSRIALLLTSSSLARSLIRILEVSTIRPLFLRISAKSSSQPHGVSVLNSSIYTGDAHPPKFWLPSL